MAAADEVFSDSFEYSCPFPPWSTYRESDEVCSPVFIMGRCPVCLVVCPVGGTFTAAYGVSAFVSVCARDDWDESWVVSPVGYEIEAKNASGKDSILKTSANRVFKGKDKHGPYGFKYGFPNMIPCKGYVELKAAGWVFGDNTLRFRVTMKGNSLQTLQPRLPERDKYARLWKDMKFPDMHMCVGGDSESLACHRAVLATASPVFDRMLSSSMKEGAERRLVLPEISFKAMRALVEYLYTGYLSEEYVEAQLLRALLPVADQYELPKLVEQCARRLVEIMSPAIACDVLSLLGTYRENPAVAEHFEAAKMALYKNPTLIDALLESKVGGSAVNIAGEVQEAKRRKITLISDQA